MTVNLVAFQEYDLNQFNKIDIPKKELKKLITLSRDGKNNMYSELYYRYEEIDEETESILFLIHIKPEKLKMLPLVLWIIFLATFLAIFTRIEKLFGFDSDVEKANAYFKTAWTQPFEQFECFLEVGGNTEMGKALMEHKNVKDIVQSVKEKV